MRREGTETKKLRELLSKTLMAGAAANRLFMDGEHWQGGDGWVGPRPQQNEEGSAETMNELQRTFVSANRIEEATERHAGGVVGREPSWGLTPREALAEGEELDDSTEQEIDELEAAATEWWNMRGVHEKLFRAVVNTLWGGRSVLRMYVPTGLRELPQGVENDLRNVLLRQVHIDVIEPESATVHEDPTTKQPLGILAYKDEEDTDVLELSYLNESDETVIEVITGDSSEVGEPLVLGGRITMFELSRRALITEQVRQQQRAHNLAMSILPRNLVTGGFLERVLLNAQQPGTWELDPDTKEPKRFIPSRLRFGSGVVTWLQGVEYTDDATGKTTTAKPDVRYRDPISPEPTVAAADATYRMLLEEVQQAHVLMNTEANVSGKSRIEARKDYESSLRMTKPVVERAGRWVIETALALAEAMMGQGGAILEKYRCDFNVRLDTGTLTPEERKQNDESVKAGTLPKEYAIGAYTDDVDAALALINSQTGVVLNEMKERAAITERFTAAGASLDAAAEAAGLDPDIVAILKRGMVLPNPDEDDRGSEED